MIRLEAQVATMLLRAARCVPFPCCADVGLPRFTTALAHFTVPGQHSGTHPASRSARTALQTRIAADRMAGPGSVEAYVDPERDAIYVR